MERLQFLDKRFRMTPVPEPNGDGKEIAVPVTDAFLSLQDDKLALEENAHWTSLLEGKGLQEMPFSTGHFTRSKPGNRT